MHTYIFALIAQKVFHLMSVCVPAFMHSPQVNTGEGGATLVPFAGVR